MTKNLKISVICFFLFGLFGANLAYAGIVPCGTSDTSPCTLCDLWQLISNIINFITFDLAVPAAILLFVAAGIVFLISSGDEQKVTLAKTIFTNTVIGVLIIFCSWLLIDTLVKTVAGDLKGIIGAWNTFPTDCK